MQITRKLTIVLSISMVTIFGCQAAVAQFGGFGGFGVPGPSPSTRPPILIDFSAAPQNFTITQQCVDDLIAQDDAFEAAGDDFITDEAEQRARNSVGLTFNLHEEILKAQAIFDERITGYRGDLPRLVQQQVDGVTIFVQFANLGPGGPLAFAAPLDTFTFAGSPFGFFNTQTSRPWTLTLTGMMTVNIDTLCFELITDDFVPTIVHEAMHALGFGTLFEANQLNGDNFFGVRTYQFDGFALATYREEAQIPFASFISLQPMIQAHWDPNDPFFSQAIPGLQDVMHPTAPPAGWEVIYTETTWAIFADLGYQVEGINSP